jgi:hypothetical protein
MARVCTGLVLALTVLVGCGDKETDDSGEAAAPEDKTYANQCLEFVDLVFDCYDTAGLDVHELGLTVDYCNAYDFEDPVMQDWFACHVEKMGEIDCAADPDEVKHEIGIVPNRCGQGR